MTAISYHNTVNDLQGLDFAPTGPFDRLGWFGLLERSGMPAVFALARAGDNALALPLMQGSRGLTNLGNWYTFTWRELTTPSSGDHALLAQLAGDLLRKTSRIVLERLPDEDGTASRLEQAFRKAGWAVEREPCDTNHVLEVRGRTYADYLAARPGQLRTTLKRKAGKLDIQIVTDFQSDTWASYEDIYAASWKPEEGDADMLRSFAQDEAANGRFRLGLATHEGQAVAAQFWTVERGTAYIHKLAHVEISKSLSAGSVLTAALFEQVIDRDRVDLVDFGTGNDPYKRDWMDHVRLRYRLVCLRPSAPANWPELGMYALRKLVSRGSAV